VFKARGLQETAGHVVVPSEPFRSRRRIWSGRTCGALELSLIGRQDPEL
jgi:hypothetical protein